MSSDVPLPSIPDAEAPSRLDVGDLRSNGDPCFKCSTCDLACPVVSVDDAFPGPKFQGPEQWRLRSNDTPIDPSIDACTNCLRCHAVCPQDVSLAAMHNVAREERIAAGTLSRTAIRNRLLANYGTLARLGSRFPRVTNWLASNGFIRRILERFVGITAEREAPTFAEQTFREWWTERGGAQVSSEEKRVAYFHGDYANFHTPAVGNALVRLYESLGYEITIPPQRCSGTPMFANGFLDDAERVARFNVEHLSAAIERGYDVVATCPSCSLALREEYPALFDFDGIETVAARTFDAIEYLRANDEFRGIDIDADRIPDALSYHAPCHAGVQGVDGQSLSIFEEAGVDVTDLGDDCSGMGGTYGWKEERYDASMAIGRDVFEALEDAAGDRAITECPTCAMQMRHGTGHEVSHPIELLADALRFGGSAEWTDPTE
ncbi:MAG: anaerobic glycerol-3-phosphate dehydrogenase subunit C [Halodesulfurarchaeum sp.]